MLQKSLNLSINADRLLGRISELGKIGRDGDGKLARLALLKLIKKGATQF
jgi:beta-ureidopropionase / N-carbamoyl-L-amino-acid hydrolase